MTESSSHTSAHASIVHKLAPWTTALRGKLTLPIHAAPHSSELVDKLWIPISVPPTGVVRDHVQWIQALRLLDLFVSIDSLACWQLIIDVCDARETMRRLGCPLEFFTEVRPRFEIQFPEHVVSPTPPNDDSLTAVRARLELRYGQRPVTYDDIMTLFCSGSRDEIGSGSEDFSRLEIELIKRIQDSPGAQHGPTQLRCVLGVRRSESCMDCWRSRCEDPVVEHLGQVLLCASRVATQGTTETARFEIQSFGFDLRDVCVKPAVCESLRQIGCKVPLGTLKYKYRSTSTESPFVWRLLAPHDNLRAHLGLRHLRLGQNESWDSERLYSAIHSSRTLEAITLDIVTAYNWLAFALFSKTAQHKISSANLTWVPGSWSDSFQGFVESTRRIINRENAPHDDTSPHPVLQWPPVVARMNAQTKIRDSYGHERDKATVYHGKRPVDCLLVGSGTSKLAQVLVPGVGAAYIVRKDVLTEQPAPQRDTHTIRNLTIRIKVRNTGEYRRNIRAYPFCAQSIAEFLRFVGEPLELLTIASVGDRPKDAFRVDDILEHCPNLKRLQLANLTLSAEQLFISKHGRGLQSLTLLSCHLIDKPRRMGCAFYVAPHTFPRLTSLYFDSTGTNEQAKIPELATVYDYILELATRRKLHRLVVKCSDAKQRARFAPGVVRHDGTLIPVLPLREKLAFLSVVTVGASASSAAKYALTMDVAHLVFEMASTTTWQRSVWTVFK